MLKFPFLTPEFVGGRQVGEQRSLILFPAFEIGKQEEGGVRSWGEGHEWNQTNGKRENLPLDWSRG